MDMLQEGESLPFVVRRRAYATEGNGTVLALVTEGELFGAADSRSMLGGLSVSLQPRTVRV